MNTRARPSISAFTLFEIAVSLGILAVSVAAIATLVPVGVRAQQAARSRAYACVVALNLLDTWAQGEHEYWDRQTEAEKCGQETFNRGVVPDLDRVMALHDYDLVPLPPAIAARLDSDGDEIARLIADGGQLFYARLTASSDLANAASMSATGTAQDPGDVRRLVFGVLGYAQQNALLNHPCLAWPYHDWFPMPPEPWERDTWHLNPSWPGEAEFDALYATCNSDANATAPPTGAAAQTYLTQAQALVAACSVATTTASGGPVPDLPQPLPPPSSSPWLATDTNVHPHAYAIWAIAHLAHAATLATADPAHTPLQEQHAVACHEAALAWAVRYASTTPYDWGAPRPLNRQTAWDYPLLQWDVFPDSAHPEIAIADSTGDVAWRVIAGEQPRDYGQARGDYGFTQTIPPNHGEIAASWGNHDHFNACAPFSAAERIRQLVCWSADWQSFEDFEEVPIAQPDSSRAFVDSRGVEVITEATWGNDHGERPFFWSDATRTAIAPLPSYGEATSYRAVIETPAYKAVWMGLSGADRDGDGRLTRGPLPKTARLRAQEIARLNVYDRRVLHALRN